MRFDPFHFIRRHLEKTRETRRRIDKLIATLDGENEWGLEPVPEREEEDET